MSATFIYTSTRVLEGQYVRRHTARGQPGSLVLLRTAVGGFLGEWRHEVDIVYLLVTAGLILVTLALVAGCAALERKK